MTNLKIVELKIVGDKLKVIFNDAFEALLVPADIIGSNPGTFGKKLLDPDFFIRVSLDEKGRLLWPNEFSVHPGHLYEYLTHKNSAA